MSLSKIIRDSLRKGMRTLRKKKKGKSHDEVHAPFGAAEAIFDKFVHSENFNEIRNLFKQLCGTLSIDIHDHTNVYEHIKNKIQTHTAKTLWRLLGKRMSQNVYGRGLACKDMKVLIIGAGPCGLRMAVEAALLGAKVTVVEMRDYIARNNVLHLWPFVIHDLKALGARVFSPKFCSGSVEHVSIRRLQHILLKVSLLLGVEVFAPVKFEHVVPPESDVTGQVKGWRAKYTPENHVVNEYQFDMIIGADGKTNTLRDFKRKVFRGKLAIAITANFLNRNTKEEAAVPEIPGLFYIFNPQFFLKLRNEATIDLENFVYFRDDTHYFVMTARKQSLLKRGVLKQDFQDVGMLLNRDNIDREALLLYAKEAADLATENKIPSLDFALNHRGQEDAAIFDFTSMHQAEHSSMIFEREGKKLLMAIVGDTLIEPFWPTGSGCARGFLSVFDTAWMMRSYCKPDKTPLQVIAERESVFQLLSQTKPDNLSRQLSNYTIDPRTRYGSHINYVVVNPSQVRHLFVTSDARLPSLSEVPRPKRYVSRRKSGKSSGVRKLDTTRLLAWYQEKLKAYSETVSVTDLTTSWRDGVALCCLIHLYRPEMIDLRGIHKENPVGNNQLAFGIIQQEFGIMPVQSPAEVAKEEGPDRLASLSYLTRLQDQLEKETAPTPGIPNELDAPQKPQRTRKRDILKRKVSSVGVLLKLSKRRKRLQAKTPVLPMRQGTRQMLPVPHMSQSPSQERRDSWQDRRMNTLDKCKGLGIASKRITLFEQGVHPDEELTIPDTKVPSTDCCICGRHLLVVERQSAHGYFFHRQCFRCATCGCSLWLGSSSARMGINEKVFFYCDRHDPAAAAAVAPLADDEIDAVFKDEEADAAQMEVDETYPSEDQSGAGATGESQEDNYMADMMRMMGIMGMGDAAWSPPSAICEADISSSDIESDDEVIEEPSDSPEQTGSIKKRFYTIATSMRLMVAHEIQQEYEEVQSEEEELQEEGKEMENTLRRKTIIEGVDKDKLTDEWIDVVKSKQDIQNHQSRLMLKARLLDLQSKFARLQRDLIGIQVTLDEQDDIEKVGKDAEKVESELTEVFGELRELRMHLQEAGETTV